MRGKEAAAAARKKAADSERALHDLQQRQAAVIAERDRELAEVKGELSKLRGEMLRKAGDLAESRIAALQAAHEEFLVGHVSKDVVKKIFRLLDESKAALTSDAYRRLHEILGTSALFEGTDARAGWPRRVRRTPLQHLILPTEPRD